MAQAWQGANRVSFGRGRQALRQGAWAVLLAMPLLACGASGGAGGGGGTTGQTASGGSPGAGGHPGSGGVTGTGGVSTSGGSGGAVTTSGGSSGSGGALAGGGGVLGTGGKSEGMPGGGGGAPGTGGKSAGSGGQAGASHQGTGGAAGTAAGGSKGGGGKPGSGGSIGTGGSGAGSGGMGTGGVSPGSGGAGGGSVSTAALLIDLGNAFCTAARTCCTAANLPSTLDDCEARFPSRLADLAKVTAGIETVDNAALSACIAGYRSTATTCAFQPLDAACRGVFVGTKAEGVACGKGGMPWTSAGGECKVTGRVTECVWTGDVNVSTTTGTCHTAERGKAGDPCAVSCAKNEDCVFDVATSTTAPTAACLEEDGLYCKSDGTNSACTPIVATGGNCDYNSFACASTDYCDSLSSPSQCRTAATLGQACQTIQCAGNMSLECDVNGKCVDLGFAFDSTCGGTPPFPL